MKQQSAKRTKVAKLEKQFARAQQSANRATRTSQSTRTPQSSAVSRKKPLARVKRPVQKSAVPTNKSKKESKAQTKRTAIKRLAKAKRTAPRNEAQYLAKPETFKDTWERVIEALSKMRNSKASLTQAAREARVSPRTVTKYGKSALRKGKSGKYVVKKNDNLLRVLSIPTAEGPRTIAVRGSKQASLLGEYWNAVHRYLQTGDTSKLKAFHEQKITDASGVEIPLLVDPAALNRLGSAGVLSFESIYARTT
jgi:hypothetical protein